MSVSLTKLTGTQLCKRVADLTHAFDELERNYKAAMIENAQLKSSRETIAKNALETCGVIFKAGFENDSLKRGMLASTGDLNKYPSPIRTMVDEAINCVGSQAHEIL